MMFPVKVAVLLTCLSLLSMGIYGMTRLKMEFRPEWMLDPEAECKMMMMIFYVPLTKLPVFPVTSWYFTHKEYFPSDGEIGQLYFKVRRGDRELNCINLYRLSTTPKTSPSWRTSSMIWRIRRTSSRMLTPGSIITK